MASRSSKPRATGSIPSSIKSTTASNRSSSPPPLHPDNKNDNDNITTNKSVDNQQSWWSSFWSRPPQQQDHYESNPAAPSSSDQQPLDLDDNTHNPPKTPPLESASSDNIRQDATTGTKWWWSWYSSPAPPPPPPSTQAETPKSPPPEEEQPVPDQETTTTQDEGISNQKTTWTSYLWSPFGGAAAPKTSQNPPQEQEESSIPPKETGDAKPSSSSSSFSTTTTTTVTYPPPSKPGVDQPETTPSWAFWSRVTPSASKAAPATTSTVTASSSSRSGELAIETETPESGSNKIKKSPPPGSTPGGSAENLKQVIQEEIARQQEETQETSRRKKHHNLVLPSLESCYPRYSGPHALKSSLKRMSSRILYGAGEDGKNHDDWQQPNLCAPPTITNAVVIGVHGFFPVRMVRSLIGEPTGTSVRFANEAALGMQRWAKENNLKLEIEKIALEGEGKVIDRVDSLYHLLENWMEHIYHADFIFLAAHSQGVPVAIQILAKLIEDGHAEGKRVGLLGMAGISLGPFSGLDQKLLMRAYTTIESDSLRELFAFQSLNSLQSRRYIQALRVVIAHGCRISFIGSANDQVVPMYSSTCINVSHPLIYRGVFVDEKVYSHQEFLVTLLQFALRLRNTGLSDHGLITQLSGYLAGPMMSSGHSLIYKEPNVYDVAIRHALQTTDVSSGVPLRADKFEIPLSHNENPFYLPWTMRGLIENSTIRQRMQNDIDLLMDQFKDWKPDNKQLKELKYRLSAISAKL